VQAVSRPCDPPCAPCARVCVERMGCDVLGYLGRTGRIHYGSRAAPPARVPARFSALSGISKGAGSARATRAGRKRDTSSPIHPPPQPHPVCPVCRWRLRSSRKGLRFSECGKKRARGSGAITVIDLRGGPIYLAPRR